MLLSIPAVAVFEDVQLIEDFADAVITDELAACGFADVVIVLEF